MSTASPATAQIGFLTIQHEQAGYLGGYLVTNPWGRPLEFRLSSAVQPNKVQHILYGKALEPFICGELIGKTLIDKAAAAAQFIIVDHPAALELRNVIAQPVGLLVKAGPKLAQLPGLEVAPRLYCHEQFAGDVSALQGLLERLGNFDLAEPFQRIREAMTEARKLGVASRAAA